MDKVDALSSGIGMRADFVSGAVGNTERNVGAEVDACVPIYGTLAITVIGQQIKKSREEKIGDTNVYPVQ